MNTNANASVSPDDDEYEVYQQNVNAMSIKFIINKSRMQALFDTVDFASDSKLTPQMRLKFFCTLLRNSVCELMKKKIKTIYHFIIKDEYEQFKNKTTWSIVPVAANEPLIWDGECVTSLVKATGNANMLDFKNIILLSCDIKDFVDNMARALDIELI